MDKKVLTLLKENLEKEGINVVNFVEGEGVNLHLIIEQLEGKNHCVEVIEKMKEICII